MLRLSAKRLRRPALALDKVIAVLVLCFSVVFLILPASSGRYTLALPLLILASAIFYLIFRRKISLSKGLPQFQFPNRIWGISHIVFVISISLSIWLLWSNLYYRPPLYFVLLLVAASSILLDIFSLEEKGLHAFVPLFKIILLSLTVYAGIYYEFPGIYGVDSWVHNNVIQGTVNLGHVITKSEFINNPYYLFPVFHLSAAVTQILTSLPTYSSVFVSVGVLMAVSCLFVFLVGRRLVSTKAGLLAALVVPLSPDSIARATDIMPMSLGFCFFSAILYLVFCRDREKSLSYIILIMLLSAALILTHYIAALVTLLSLAAIFTGIKCYKQISKPATAYEVVSLSLIIFFGVAMLLRWTQDAPWGSFFDEQFGDALGSLLIRTGYIPTTILPSQTGSIAFLASLNSYLLWIVSQGGDLLLFAFSIIGSLSYLHPQNRTGLRMALIVTAAALFVIPHISYQLDAGNAILADRWYIFLNVPLFILAVQGLVCVSHIIKSNLGKLSLIMVMMLAILFMMTVTNRNTNSDSPLFYQGLERDAYTESEISAARTLSTMGDGRPVTDRYYGWAFPYIVGHDSYVAMLEKPGSYVFILRNYNLHHPEWNEKFKTEIHTGSIGKLGKTGEVLVLDYMKEKEIDKQPLIYSNGNVRMFVIPKLD